MEKCFCNQALQNLFKGISFPSLAKGWQTWGPSLKSIFACLFITGFQNSQSRTSEKSLDTAIDILLDFLGCCHTNSALQTVPTRTGQSFRRGGVVTELWAHPSASELEKQCPSGAGCWRNPSQAGRGLFKSRDASGSDLVLHTQLMTLNTGAMQMVSDPCETLGTWHTTWLMSHL